MSRKVDLFSADLAEALFRFVQQDPVFDDFCEKASSQDLSIAEYVDLYKRSDFFEFCIKKGFLSHDFTL